MIGTGQIGDHRCKGVSFLDMQNITLGNLQTTKSSGIRVISDFQYPSFNVSRITSEKTLNVIAVDRQPSIQAPITTQRLNSAQATKIHFPNRYRMTTTWMLKLQPGCSTQSLSCAHF